MPYSTETDALLRSIEESLVSWEERVRVVNRLAAIDTALSRRRRPGVAVSQAARVLGAHLDALLALLAGPMVRVRADAAVIEELDGADAGLELLELRYRARKILGETRPQRETLDGVPCRTCDELALERADLVPGRESEAPYSRCGACGDQLTRPEYDDWAARYAAWARGADGIKCRRCSLGRHADCCWTPCACALSGHLARAS